MSSTTRPSATPIACARTDTYTVVHSPTSHGCDGWMTRSRNVCHSNAPRGSDLTAASPPARLELVQAEVPLGEDLLVRPVRLHARERLGDRVVQRGVALAGGDPGEDLAERLARDRERVGLLRRDERDGLGRRAVDVDLLEAELLQRVGVAKEQADRDR